MMLRTVLHNVAKLQSPRSMVIAAIFVFAICYWFSSDFLTNAYFAISTDPLRSLQLICNLTACYGSTRSPASKDTKRSPSRLIDLDKADLGRRPALPKGKPAVIILDTAKTSREHMAIISSTYYAKMTGSYAPNTIVTLFNARSYDTPPFDLLCISRNASSAVTQQANIIRMQKDMKQCAWTQYVAICKTVKEPESFFINDRSLLSDIQPAKIPFRHAVSRKVEVAMCFSPFFYFDRWQLLLLSLEVYRQHGVDVQVYYVESALSTVVDVLKVYEKRQLAHIEPWTLIDVGDSSLGYNPNEELNWRNQPAAVTDCVLNFKASAKFIIVGDVDDIIFPNLGRTYYDEFTSLLTLTPNAAGFIYKRYNSHFATSHSFEQFSLAELLSTTNFTNEFVGPKSVVIPTRVQTVWQHFPQKIEKGYRMVRIPEPTNLFVHFRQWTGVDSGSGWQRNYTTSPNAVFRMTDIFSRERAEELQKAFELFVMETKSEDIFRRLPTEAYYFKLFYDCFFQLYHKFYMRVKEVKRCPGPGLCSIPSIKGLACGVASRRFVHQKIGKNLFLHYSESPPTLEQMLDGCTM